MTDGRPGGAGASFALTLLTRRTCSLCDEFEHALLRWNARNGAHPLAVIDVDLAADAELAARYGLRVPVLLLAGEEVCAVRFDEDALARGAASA